LLRVLLFFNGFDLIRIEKLIITSETTFNNICSLIINCKDLSFQYRYYGRTIFECKIKKLTHDEIERLVAKANKLKILG